MKRRNEPKFQTGISSLLMVTVILSLTVFGLLSYSSAAADLRLSQKAADHIQNYYTAEKKAAEAVAAADEALGNGCLPEKLGNASSLLSGIKVEDQVLTLRVPVDDTQELQVLLQLENGGKRCSVTSSQLVSTKIFEENTDIEVWQGQ